MAFVSVLLLTLLSGLSGGALSPIGLLTLRGLTLIGTAAWLVGMIHGGRVVLPPGGALLPLLLLVGWAGVSAVVSPVPLISLEAFTADLMDLAAVLLGCSVIRTSPRRMWWLRILLGSAALLGLYGLTQALGLGWTPRLTAARVSSLYFNSNHYAGFLALLTPLTLALCLNGRGRAGPFRSARALLSTVLAVSLFLSFSWAILPVMGICAVLLLRSFKAASLQLPRWSLGLLTAAAALLTVAGLLASPQLATGSWKARASELTGTWVQQSLGSRWLIWLGSAQIIRASPLLGAGPGNFEVSFTRYRSPTRRSFAEGLTHAEVNYAHNDLLQVGTAAGVPGMLAFLTFWVMVLRGGRGRVATALRAGLLASLLYGVTDCNLTQIPGNALLAYLGAGILLGTAPETGMKRCPAPRLKGAGSYICRSARREDPG